MEAYAFEAAASLTTETRFREMKKNKRKKKKELNRVKDWWSTLFDGGAGKTADGKFVAQIFPPHRSPA